MQVLSVQTELLLLNIYKVIMNVSAYMPIFMVVDKTDDNLRKLVGVIFAFGIISRNKHRIPPSLLFTKDSMFSFRLCSN